MGQSRVPSSRRKSTCENLRREKVRSFRKGVQEIDFDLPVAGPRVEAGLGAVGRYVVRVAAVLAVEEGVEVSDGGPRSPAFLRVLGRRMCHEVVTRAARRRDSTASGEELGLTGRGKTRPPRRLTGARGRRRGLGRRLFFLRLEEGRRSTRSRLALFIQSLAFGAAPLRQLDQLQGGPRGAAVALLLLRGNKQRRLHKASRRLSGSCHAHDKLWARSARGECFPSSKTNRAF